MAGRPLAFLFVLITLAAGVTPLAAQTPASPAAAAAPIAPLDRVQGELAALEQQAQASDLDDDALARLSARLAPIQAELGDILAPLNARAQATSVRLARLGPAPPRGAPPESVDVAKARADQTAAKARLEADLKRGGLLQVEADQFGRDLVRRRLDRFSRRLSTRSESVLAPDLWAGVALELPADVRRLVELAQDSVDHARAAPMPGALFGAALALVIAGLLAWPVRGLLEGWAERFVARRIDSHPLRRSELAIVQALLRTALPVAAASALVWGLEWAGLLGPQLVDLGWAGVRAVAFASAAGALGGAILSPGKPERRLAPLDDGLAQRLAPYPFLLGGATALGAFLLYANRIVGAGLSASIAGRCLVALAEVAVLILALAAAGRARAAQAETVLARKGGAPDPRASAAPSRGPAALIMLIVWLVLAAAVVALLAGYLAFARFVAEELVWTLMVAAGAWLITQLTDDLFEAFSPEKGPVGRFAVSSMGLTPRTLDQLAVLFSGVARLVIWLIAWATILGRFGAGTDDLLAHLRAGTTALRLGEVTISPLAIVTAIGLFVLGLFVTRLFRRWLETRYLPKTRLDRSLAATVTTGVSYAGGLIALTLAVSYLGIKLSQITLIASALSVGIGFGLQSVIQNFVAGLILLVGRPIRTGDWISVGGQDGDVQRINVRATEIRMADRSVLIVPNSELVSKTVRNLTWGDPLGMVGINLTVGFDTDPELVGALLLEALASAPGVLKDPAPSIALTELKDTGLALSGTAYVSSPRAVYRARSDVLFDVARRMRGAGLTPGATIRQMRVKIRGSATAGNDGDPPVRPPRGPARPGESSR